MNTVASVIAPRSLVPIQDRRRVVAEVFDRVSAGTPDRQVSSAAWGEKSLAQLMVEERARIEFQLQLLLELLPEGGSVVDIGGGITHFASGAAVLGYQISVVDDFSDTWHDAAKEIIQSQIDRGVKMVSCDVVRERMPFALESVDLFTSFDCLEHLSVSPRTMLHQATEMLRPGGQFLIAVPNCVNLRKRLTVPFGFGKWSQMAEWYDEPIFRGHVREPDVDDLRYIARDLGLTDVRILGRNWLGYRSRYALARVLTPYVDKFLQAFPQLCANIYLIGRKPAG